MAGHAMELLAQISNLIYNMLTLVYSNSGFDYFVRGVEKTVERKKTAKSDTMTRECLYMALLILMEQKPYEEITITEIAKKAGVSRMSYYRIYKSKDDILIQYFNDIFEEYLKQIKHMKEIDRYQSIILLFTLCKDHHVLLENVFHAGLYKLVIERLMRYCAYIAEYVFQEDMTDPKTEYLIFGEAGRFVLMIYCWLKNKMPQSPEDMAELFLEGNTL